MRRRWRGSLDEHRVISVAHVITGLELGGAEMVLYRLLQNTDRTRFDPVVISLSSVGPVGERIAALGIPVVALGTRSVEHVAALPKLIRFLRAQRPDVVQTWMYHADILGGIAARLGVRQPIAWGLHATPFGWGSGMGLRAALRGAAALSHVVPTKIVACSYDAERQHAALGYARAKMTVILNGFDIRDPVPGARATLIDELGLTEDALLVGRLARWHPYKDYGTLLRAFRVVRDRVPNAHLVAAGADVSWSNEELVALLESLDLKPNVHLLGIRGDAELFNSACDVAVSSSASEALPVVLGEAMGLGTPVVTTDVGDSARLVGDRRFVVPPRHPHDLAAAVIALLEMDESERRAIGRAGRDRIAADFGAEQMAVGYGELYRSLASAGR